jgi:hypothetical protein
MYHAKHPEYKKGKGSTKVCIRNNDILNKIQSQFILIIMLSNISA